MGTTTMPNSAAAIWSAVAASFAALSSFLIMLIQRRNLLESVRPELVLIGWTRTAEGQVDAAHEVIAFQTIKNVGRGAALHIHLNAFHEVAHRPTAVLSTTRIPILATNEATDVNRRIVVSWQNVEPNEGVKHLAITITIFCWDSRGMRHETRYSLFAVELSPHVVVADEIAPGVVLTHRTTTTRSVRVLKLFSKLGRIPGLGRWFRKTT
jgi:heme exporter protein D